MPASAERRAVEREVAELERLCAEAEKHLVAGDWASVANSLRDSRRVTHAFSNAMEAAGPDRDETFDKRVYARVRRVFDVREDQLQRLRAFHDGVAERLRTLSQWNVFARSVGAKRAPKKTTGFDVSR